MTDRRAEALDQKNVMAAHAAMQLDKDIFIGEIANIRFRQFRVEFGADFFRQGPIAASAEKNGFAVRSNFFHASRVVAGNQSRAGREWLPPTRAIYFSSIVILLITSFLRICMTTAIDSGVTWPNEV